MIKERPFGNVSRPFSSWGVQSAGGFVHLSFLTKFLEPFLEVVVFFIYDDVFAAFTSGFCVSRGCHHWALVSSCCKTVAE